MKTVSNKMDVSFDTVDDYVFGVEKALEDQATTLVLPFDTMDKACEEECKIFEKTRSCFRGRFCPYRHIKSNRTTMCKHWLRGLCKKGDQCDYLHRYDLSQMPECHFFAQNGECHNMECLFRHVDPESKKGDCQWFARGFCRHGPYCKNRHVKKVVCVNYLCGFCPDGKNCKQTHPPWEIPVELRNEDGVVLSTTRLPTNTVVRVGADGSLVQPDMDSASARPLSEVTCFKCRQKGHYANVCTNARVAPPPDAADGQALLSAGEISKLVAVDDTKVGLIIGKGGMTYRALQEETGCKITIPKTAEPGDAHRNITLVGTASQVNDCEAKIMGKISGNLVVSMGGGGGNNTNNAMPQPGEGEVSVVIPCPSNKVGILIGKAGATHRSLQETTKCRVHIPKDAEPGQDHRNITVVGTPMQTQHCKELIMDRLRHVRTGGQQPQQRGGFAPPGMRPHPQQPFHPAMGPPPPRGPGGGMYAGGNGNGMMMMQHPPHHGMGPPPHPGRMGMPPHPPGRGGPPSAPPPPQNNNALPPPQQSTPSASSNQYVMELG